MRNWRGAHGLLACLVLACGDDTDNSATLEGATACERFTSLAEVRGCRPPTTCNVEEPCDEAAVRWVNCVATDLDQCICESDGDLNCEGSWKPDEGPARCMVEYSAFDACEMQGAKRRKL